MALSWILYHRRVRADAASATCNPVARASRPLWRERPAPARRKLDQPLAKEIHRHGRRGARGRGRLARCGGTVPLPRRKLNQPSAKESHRHCRRGARGCGQDARATAGETPALQGAGCPSRRRGRRDARDTFEDSAFIFMPCTPCLAAAFLSLTTALSCDTQRASSGDRPAGARIP
jgi:hypothetical protein